MCESEWEIFSVVATGAEEFAPILIEEKVLVDGCVRMCEELDRVTRDFDAAKL